MSDYEDVNANTSYPILVVFLVSAKDRNGSICTFGVFPHRELALQFTATLDNDQYSHIEVSRQVIHHSEAWKRAIYKDRNQGELKWIPSFDPRTGKTECASYGGVEFVVSTFWDGTAGLWMSTTSAQMNDESFKNSNEAKYVAEAIVDAIAEQALDDYFADRDPRGDNDD